MTLRSFTLSLLMVLMVFGSSSAAIVVPPVKAPTSTTEAEILEAARAYKESLKEMSGKERRQLKRQQRAEIKQALEDNQGVEEGSVLLIILAIILPPLAVFLYEGAINTKFWISLLLTLLFFLPGIIYALLVITGNA